MNQRLPSNGPAGTVAIVEPPVSQWYARRASATALVVGLASDVLVTAVLSVFCPLLLAVVLGALAGVVCAFRRGGAGAYLAGAAGAVVVVVRDHVCGARVRRLGRSGRT